MTTSLRKLDSGDVLHIERFLPHHVSKVWRCLTEPDMLKTWFPSQVELDLRLGGGVRFFGDPEMPGEQFGTIAELDPPRVIAFEWGEDLLRWQVAPHPDGSVLILDQTVADRPGAASFAAGWSMCLDSLVAGLATEPSPAEDTHRPSWAERHEEFVVALGLDSAVVSGDDEGWTVELERQLTVPVESARKLLPKNLSREAELTSGNGGARLVAVRSGLPSRQAAEALRTDWESATRRIASQAALIPG